MIVTQTSNSCKTSSSRKGNEWMDGWVGGLFLRFKTIHTILFRREYHEKMIWGYTAPIQLPESEQFIIISNKEGS